VSSGIPPEVERFIHDHITSIEQLEILLLLQDNPHKSWSALEASRVLYRQEASVTERLEHLLALGLVEVQSRQPTIYCYNARSPHYEVVRTLERVYKERKDSVIHLIFAKPNQQLRAFSNAFRLRKDSGGET
jgi:hypothetical protein